MAGSSEDGKSTFQVRDRRRFDAEGNERTDEPAIETGSRKPEEKKKVEEAPSPPEFTMSDPVEGEDGSEEDGIDFSSFVMSLATQALVQLGEMHPPAGMEIPLDPESARQTIDILSMLKRKTKGNLSAVENQLVDDILHNLRMSYLRHSR